jgi:hypothetical protein
MATLKSLAVRFVDRNRWKLAPKASQMEQLGRAASINSRPKPIAWMNAVPAAAF